jgi:hypothetical protein
LLEESLRKKMTEDEAKRQHAEERAATEQRINALEEALMQSNTERRTTADAIGALRAELERQQWQSCMLRDRVEQMLESAAEQDGTGSSHLSGGDSGSERGGQRVRSLCSMRNEVALPQAFASSESALPFTQASSSIHAVDTSLPPPFTFSADATSLLTPENVQKEIRDTDLERMIPLEWRRRVRDNERKL